MKNIYKALLIIAVLCQHGIAYSQGKEMQPTFKGIITTNGRLNSIPDTIEVIYHRPYTPYRTNYETFTITTDKDGNFSFRLPNFKEPATMSFWVMKNGRAVTEMARKRYFFENTDKVYLNIDKNISGISVIFNGNGADKYKLIDELVKLGSPAEINTEFRNGIKEFKLGKRDSLEIKLNRLAEFTMKLVKNKERIIANSTLNERMKRLISYEYAPIYSDWKFRLVGMYARTYKNDLDSRMLIKKNFNANKVKFKTSNNNDLALCPSYLHFLAQDEAYNLLINSTTDSISFSDLYNVLTQKYSGLVRERLVANLFLGYAGSIPEMQMNSHVIDSLMNEGHQYITIPFVKQIYNSQQKLSIGKQVFDGSFIDLNGKNVSLSSLRNRVVLIDLWFTGCGACAKFHHDFHKDFYPLLKLNRNFVYLSISVDSSVEKWKRGLETENYTSMDYLNVYAVNGFNHPFNKYYYVGGAPFILILDKEGKISANFINGPKEAYELIQKALKNGH